MKNREKVNIAVILFFAPEKQIKHHIFFSALQIQNDYDSWGMSVSLHDVR